MVEVHAPATPVAITEFSGTSPGRLSLSPGVLVIAAVPSHGELGCSVAPAPALRLSGTIETLSSTRSR